jgi:DNA-binding Xre family transcriptional regulator
MIISSKVDEVMESKDLSLDQLIEKTGLTRMTLFNARKGSNVTLKTALAISEALEVPLEEIWSTEDSFANVLTQ